MTLTAVPVDVSQAEERDGAATSVTKALSLLDAFRWVGPVAGVSELARATGLPKSTAFRLLNQLASSGFLNRLGTAYRLDQHVFELGNCVPMCAPGGLRSIAAPFLSDLFATSRTVVHLAVLDGADVLYLDKIQGNSTVKVPTVVGSRVAASCSALGKAMLPFGHKAVIERILEEGLQRRTRYSIAAPHLFLQELARIRTNGIAFDREEVALGVLAVAAPILWNGSAIAAISTSGPVGRFDPAVLATKVKRSANEISALYGARMRDLELDGAAL